MKDLLNTIGVLNDDNKVSLTNLIVIIFVTITAFKMLFAGVIIDTRLFDWKVESPDVATTLPLLFSLLNYGHKRLEYNKFTQNTEGTNDKQN